MEAVSGWVVIEYDMNEYEARVKTHFTSEFTNEK